MGEKEERGRAQQGESRKSQLLKKSLIFTVLRLVLKKEVFEKNSLKSL